MVENLLINIAIIFTVSIVVLFICLQIRVSSILGLLITGIIVGPHGLGLIHNIVEVDIFAEIGVVLLLFTIGLEFSLKDVLNVKKLFIIGGFLQVFLTVVISATIIRTFGIATNTAIFFGFLISLSSTAIVLKQLQEKSLVESPFGNAVIAILIFQDIIIVPMMLITPILAGKEGNLLFFMSYLILKGILIILAVVFLARVLVPFVLHQIAKTRSRELFLFSIVSIFLVTALSTSYMGLSLSLGAFLAGIVISESEYSHYAISNIIPFKNLFAGFFFVSIGILLNTELFLDNFFTIFTISIFIIFLKFGLTFAIVVFLKYPLRLALLTGFTLSQIGEFSFILSKIGLDAGLINNNFYQIFLSASILTMAASPFIFNFSLPFSEFVQNRFNIKRKILDIDAPFDRKFGDLKDHIIIVGFGLTGRFLARSLKASDIKYVILEMNPETVKTEAKKGEPILFGDATNISILKLTNISDSRVAVIAISDLVATRSIVKTMRDINASVYIIARTPYVSETKLLLEYGADEVIPEDYETSIEILARTLFKYLIPKNDIEKFISEIRSNTYGMLRNLAGASFPLSDLKLNIPDLNIVSIRIGNCCDIYGKSIGEINFRNRFGITILAVNSGGKIITNPSASYAIKKEDIIIIAGTEDKIIGVNKIFGSNY